MSAAVAIPLVLALFVVLLAAEMPVALALVAAGTAGLLLTDGLSQTEATLASAPFESASTYSLVVIPMFILMGVLVSNAGVLRDLFSLAHRVTRRVPGGLGVATVLSAAGFAAVTGSSAAAVATLGRLCVGEMRRHGYSVQLAAGIVAASGTLGILIPPSIVLVIYGVITTESIGLLLIGAIIPGLLTAAVYIVTIVLRVVLQRRRVDPSARVVEGSPVVVEGSPVVEDAAETDPVEAPADRRRSLTREYEAAFYILVVFLVVLGGIYSGVFTETEAGAMGALCALVVLLLRASRTELGLVRSFTAALRETASVTSMIFALLLGGTVLTLFLVTSRVPTELADWVAGLQVNGLIVVLVFLVILLILGGFLDGVSILLLTVPLAYPVVVTELGFSGIWFGILVVKMIEIGLLTPPFGINVYLVAGVVKGVRVEDAFRGAFPFVLAELAVVAILILFPGLVTWLPGLAGI